MCLYVWEEKWKRILFLLFSRKLIEREVSVFPFFFPFHSPSALRRPKKVDESFPGGNLLAFHTEQDRTPEFWIFGRCPPPMNKPTETIETNRHPFTLVFVYFHAPYRSISGWNLEAFPPSVYILFRSWRMWGNAMCSGWESDGTRWNIESSGEDVWWECQGGKTAECEILIGWRIIFPAVGETEVLKMAVNLAESGSPEAGPECLYVPIYIYIYYILLRLLY